MGVADSQKLLPRRGLSHSPPGRKPPAYGQINSSENVRDSRPRRRHGVPRSGRSSPTCVFRCEWGKIPFRNVAPFRSGWGTRPGVGRRGIASTCGRSPR
jgi:hypothetical protein